MSKMEQYFKEIQKIATNNIKDYKKYLEQIDYFLNNQKILKNNKIKSISDKIKIFFVEYVNEVLSNEYYSNNKEGVDIFSFLYYKINKVCLEIKAVCTDEVMCFILTNKIDKINSIIIDDFSERQDKIKELEEKIKELKKGMI